MSRLRQSVRMLLQVQDSPNRIALAFGLGVWIAFFPIIGIHTGLALLIAFLFRLNRLAILLGTYVNNPWTVAPMYMAGTLFGCMLLGVSTHGLWEVNLRISSWGFFLKALHTLRPFLWPYLIGNVLVGTVAGATAYAALRVILERRRRP
jgi:uncharacterized protein